MYVYIGTYTAGASEGIYLYRLDMVTGALHYDSAAADKANPSFLTIDATGRYLYAVNELSDGAVTAYAVDQVTRRLTRLNRQPTHGAAPCYINLDRTGRYALVANYSGGSVTVLPIRPDGSLGEATDVVRHEGSGLNPKRQEGPHPHSIQPDPSGSWVLVPDLGLDRIFTYKLDAGKLTPGEAHAVPPGAGPRHMAFHPTAPYVYVISELASCITVYRRDSFTELQRLSTLPAGFAGDNTGADIHIHPSGRFLYASNRGHDSIAIYHVDATGGLTLAGHESTRGHGPRNFALDPTGQFLLAANQHSDTVVTFRIDQQTGALTFTGHAAAVPSPTCVLPVPSDRRQVP